MKYFVFFILITLFSCGRTEKASRNEENQCNITINSNKNRNIPAEFFKNLEAEEVDLLIYDGIPLSLSDIRSIRCFKKLKKLKLHLKSDIYLHVIKDLKLMKELTLSGEGVNKVTELPQSLNKLSLFNTHIQNFEFLRDTNVKEVKIVTSLPQLVKRKDFIIKKYPEIRFTFNDSLFFSKTLKEYSVKRWTNDISIKRSLKEKEALESQLMYLTNVNQLFKKRTYHGFFLDSQETKLIQFIRERILEEDWDFLFLSDHTLLAEYLLLYYPINLNKLIKGKTLLDRIGSNIGLDMISILRKHGAKRSCELLKKGCHPVGDK